MTVALPTNGKVREDGFAHRFHSYLLAERNASELTAAGYLQDLSQFAGQYIRVAFIIRKVRSGAS